MKSLCPGVNRKCSADLLVAGFYLAISIAFTFPLVLNFDSGIYGYPGDATSAIWQIWADKDALANGTSLGDWLGLPFGVDESGRVATVYSRLVAVVALLRNEVFAYNLFIFASFPLSALAAYALAYKVTRKRAASVVAGLIYAFGPYQQWHARYYALYDAQWMPLFLLALWYFEERPSWQRALLAAASYYVVAMVNAYYGLFAAVAGLTFVICHAVYYCRVEGFKLYLNRARIFTRGLVVVAIVAAVIPTYWSAFSGILSKLGSGGQPNSLLQPGEFQRQVTWPFYLSARPWDYLLPSEDHPVFGAITHRVIEKVLTIKRGDWVPEAYRYLNLDNDWFWSDIGPIERTLFLGYTGLSLSLYSAWTFWKGRRAQTAGSRYGHFFFLCFAVVAIWCSAPPWLPIGSLFQKWLPAWASDWVIPFPVWFWYKFLPLRASVRFGVLVLLSVAVLAAAGLSSLLERLKTPAGRWLVTGLISLLILFEFWSVPPFTRLYPAPKVYDWLAAQPNGIVASYPWTYELDRLYQPVYKKPLAGHPAGSGASQSLVTLMRTVVGNLHEANTPAKLAGLGVKYVLWHTRDPYGPIPPVWAGNFSQPLLGDNVPGLRLLETSDVAQVYEVVAPPAELVVLFTPLADVWISNAQWAWEAQEQHLWIWNPTDQIVRTDMEFGVGCIPYRQSLIATLTRTPPPRQIYDDGMLVANPLADLKYSLESYKSIGLDEGSPRLRFAALPILPGETEMTLRWDTPSPSCSTAIGISVELAPTR